MVIMKLHPVLALSVLFALASMAAASSAPTPAAAKENAPAPDIVRLEQILTDKLQAKEKGQVTAEAFAEFVAQFRADLAETVARVTPSPANTGLHARILARLQEPGEALARLDEALQQEPNNATLLNARGYVQLQQGDFSGALASAKQVLKYNEEHGQPADKGALSLKYSSEGRIAGEASSTHNSSPAAAQSQVIDGPADASKPYKLAVKGSAKYGDVPAVTTAEKEPVPTRRRSPLLPALILTGASLTVIGGYKVSKSNGTSVSSEGLNPAPDVSPEQVRRNYLNSVVLIGTPILALGLVYGGLVVLRVAAPIVTSLAQRLQGSPLPAVASGAGAELTKGSARTALQGMALPPNQLQAASRAIQRATLSDTIKMTLNKGGDLILKVSRPGRDGFQEFEHTISPNGTKQVIQRAYNSAGQLVHFDPKTQ
ncbi:MAG: hypothetical protein ABL955_07845 [Elusimicrobiota bacterium]